MRAQNEDALPNFLMVCPLAPLPNDLFITAAEDRTTQRWLISMFGNHHILVLSLPAWSVGGVLVRRTRLRTVPMGARIPLDLIYQTKGQVCSQRSSPLSEIPNSFTGTMWYGKLRNWKIWGSKKMSSYAKIRLGRCSHNDFKLSTAQSVPRTTFQICDNSIFT